MMKRDAGEDGTSTDADGAAISEEYFPLLAAVLPEWLRGFAIDETPRPGERRRDATPMRREKSFSELRKAAALAVSAAAKAANLAGTDVSTAVSAAVAEYTAGLRPTPANSPLGNSNAAGIAATAVPVVRRVVFLVSGFGAPRDATHAPDDNSTAATARLMKRFIEASYPNVAVKLVHGGQDAFRYAANGAFFTLVPIRPRWRGGRRSLRTLRRAPRRSTRARTRTLASTSAASQSAPTPSMDFFGLGPTVTVGATFAEPSDASSTRTVSVKSDASSGGVATTPTRLYTTGDTIAGAITLTTPPGSKVDHLGVKVEVLGQIEMGFDRG